VPALEPGQWQETINDVRKCKEFDAGMNGYAGKRRGISAQLQAAWKF